MNVISYVFYILVLIFLLIYIYFRKKFCYWKNMGIPYIKPIFPIGNLQGPSHSKHTSVWLQDFYNVMKYEKKITDKFFGIFFFNQPVVIPLELKLIKSILIKDFSFFHDRGIFYNEIDDPLSAHLFSIEGEKWKKLRNKMSPAFTSGKMKYMFPTILEVANQLTACIRGLNKSNTEENNMMEMKEILARFTTDVVGTCAFGIDCNSLMDPEAEFRSMGRRILEHPRNSPLVSLFIVTFRNLARKFRCKANRDDVLKFFMGIVQQTITYREKNNIQRKDFMDLMIKLKNRPKTEEALTINDISAQCFVFFLAGFETSSTAMTFCLYELAVNPNIQTKLRETINCILTKYSGQLTYDGLLEMEYLDKVLNECLRKYPPVGSIVRTVSKDYTIPETNIVLEKDVQIWITNYAIHNDPEFYPNPDIFDPERFSEKEIQSRNPITYLPFGEGPRNCIGIKFGLMQAKIGLVVLLRDFVFSLCEKSNNPLVLDPKSLVLSPAHSWLEVKYIH